MAPNPAPPDSALTRRRRLTGISVLAVASLLTTGGVALAGSGSSSKPDTTASSTESRADGVHGTVTSVGAQGFTVEGRAGGTSDVTTSGSTEFYDTTTAGVADVEVGSYVVVAGPLSEDGDAVQARHLAVKPRPADTKTGRADGARRAGTVVANDGETLTVDTDEGELTVRTDRSTSVSITTEAAFADVEVGDRVTVRGSIGDDGTVAAARVHLGVGGKAPGDEVPDDTTTTTAPPETTTTAPPPPTTDPAEPAPPAPSAAEAHEVAGTVTSIDGPSFVVQRGDGSSVTVVTNEATSWGAGHGRHGDRGSSDSLEVGDHVIVKGTLTDGVLMASWVKVAGEHHRWHEDHDSGDDRGGHDHRDGPDHERGRDGRGGGHGDGDGRGYDGRGDHGGRDHGGDRGGRGHGGEGQGRGGRR